MSFQYITLDTRATTGQSAGVVLKAPARVFGIAAVYGAASTGTLVLQGRVSTLGTFRTISGAYTSTRGGVPIVSTGGIPVTEIRYNCTDLTTGANKSVTVYVTAMPGA